MRNTGEPLKLGRRPGLDGVRGLAIILVLLCHAAVPGLELAGQAGVTLFFVLSGFLITGLLLGGQSLGTFWTRRARRLLPALLTMLGLLAPLFFVAGWTIREYGAAAWPGLLYVANLREMHTGWTFPFGHLWSLSVEEQFYLLWPLVVLALRRRSDAVLAASLVGMGASMLARVFAGGMHTMVGADTNAYAMLAGAATAAAFAGGRLPQLGRRSMVAGGALVAVSAVWPPTVGPVPLLAFLTTAGAVLIITGEVHAGAPILRLQPLRYAGRVSYGWYLWHLPLITLFSTPGHPGGTLVKVLLCGVALGVAALSYQFVELPAQRRPAQAPEAAPLATA